MPKRLLLLNTVHSIATAIQKADNDYVKKVFGKTIFTSNEKKRNTKNKRKKAK